MKNSALLLQKTYNRSLLLFFLFAILVSPVFGEMFFSDLDLNFNNQLLFKSNLESSSSIQNTLFLTRLRDGERQSPVQQLTVFPERMELIMGNQVLLIRNSQGIFTLPASGGLPAPLSGFASFNGRDFFGRERPEEMLVSPNGRWLLYLEAVSPAMADLYILDINSGERTIISRGLQRPDTVFPASWSPDSRYFVYEKSGYIYYNLMSPPPVQGDESYRQVGQGRINSIAWSGTGDFYYLRNSTLYHVHSARLFTMTIYTNFLDAGTVVGNIPLDFDPSFDNFWVAPDASSVLLSKSNRSLFYFPFVTGSFSYLALPRRSLELDVLWSPGGIATALVYTQGSDGKVVSPYRLNLSSGASASFETLPSPGFAANYGLFSSAVLSPDGNLVLFSGTGGILLYDYNEWDLLDVVSFRSGVSSIWTANNEFITGDIDKIERIRLHIQTGGQPGISGRELICLSQTQESYFESGSDRIAARSGDLWYISDGSSAWAPITSTPVLKLNSIANAQFRVFLEDQVRGIYTNIPMVRNLAAAYTFPLISPAPSASSDRRDNRIAVAFDLYDDDTGLSLVLASLNRLGIRATFFLNGEFIRRHPDAAAEIAAAGHETASMFYTPVDLSDARYRTGGDFIPRGLARNEDEFFRASGSELSLLWHPPWYITSPLINTAASDAGYTTVTRDIDPFDWISWEESIRLGLAQHSPAEIIENIVDSVRPGFIIPIRLGLLNGGRNAYLFNSINVLLDALIQNGYSIGTVSEILSNR